MRQIVFLPDGTGGYTVEVPSLPGCHAKGRNISEAVRNARKAIYRHMEDLLARGLPIPEATVIDIPKAEGVVRHDLLLREDVVKAAQETFPDQDLQMVLGLLDEFGKEPFETDPEYVHMAIIRLSEGQLDKLRILIADAKRDPRDVLSWYATKYGKYP